MTSTAPTSGRIRRTAKSIRQMKADLEGIERLIAMQLSLLREIRQELQGCLDEALDNSTEEVPNVSARHRRSP